MRVFPSILMLFCTQLYKETHAMLFFIQWSLIYIYFEVMFWRSKLQNVSHLRNFIIVVIT